MDNSTEKLATQALKKIARDEGVKTYLLSDKKLYTVLLKAAQRFIGGETLTQCVKAAKELNQRGFAVTIDYMGESTRNVNQAMGEKKEFLRLIEAIKKNNMNSSVSLDLSHIGLAVDIKLAYKNISELAKKAKDYGVELMISMEGSERTQEILDVYNQVCQKFENVGITIQAYLHTTASDLKKVLQKPGKIRLVKGAYQEPIGIAKARGDKVDQEYKKFIKMIFQQNHRCSIATHDISMINFACSLIEKDKRINKSNVEFEMLKGINLEKLKRVKALRHNTRIYLPYGKEWYLYLCHRLAEHPPNIYQALFDIVEQPNMRVS